MSTPVTETPSRPSAGLEERSYSQADPAPPASRRGAWWVFAVAAMTAALLVALVLNAPPASDRSVAFYVTAGFLGSALVGLLLLFAELSKPGRRGQPTAHPAAASLSPVGGSGDLERSVGR